MVKRDHGDYEDVVPLPVSTREPGEGSGLLSNGYSDKRVGAFDVEFDIEDDVLLNWQHARPHGWFFRCLPRRWQQAPECWRRLSQQQQRSFVIVGGIALGVLLLCLAIVGAAMLSSSQQSKQQVSQTDSDLCSWADLYLPRGISPTKYTLHVRTTLQEPYQVHGQVDIQLQAAGSTPCVVLHAHHSLNIASVRLLVYKAGDLHKQQPQVVKGSVASRNKTSQQAILRFPQALPQQPLVPVLRLQFSYLLQEGLDGFYRSSYIDASNRTRVMASTQFQSIAARKAFPCFDEPLFKAVFEVKVSAPPPPIVVLSNMPLSHTHGAENEHGHEHDNKHEHGADDKHDEEPAADQKLTEDDLIAYHFKPTPPMSSYLVAWVVGHLSHNQLECEMLLPPPAPDSHDSSSGHGRRLAEEPTGPAGRNVTVRVWGTDDRVQQFGHARDVACGALREMERLTGIAYALPKLDLVAIPNFAAGAMENWGLLMYRERSLLVDDAKDDMHQRYAIATTVAHEVAHQWCGNLATLIDWTQLWMNEGLASYLEVVLADAYQPGMGYLTNFFADSTTEGLEADGSLASHPLTVSRRVQKLSEIDNWFDSVSYNKGAAVLRMLRAWLNRGNNTLTGLAANDTAAAAGLNEDGKYVSTSQTWAPHLRKLRSSTDSIQHNGHSTRGMDATTHISAAGVPRLLPVGSLHRSNASDPSSVRYKKHHHAAPARRHHNKSPSIHPVISPQALQAGSQQAGPGAAATDHVAPPPLVVLPIDAPVPAPAASGSSSSSPSSAAAAGTARPATSSVGSKAAWLTEQQLRQGSPSRELGRGGPGAAGSDSFMSGLSRYLAAHAYSNSNYTGLWQGMAAASGEPVLEMMSTWTLRRGFPIITISLADQGSGSSSNKRSVKVEQVPYHAPRTYMVGLPFEPEMYCNDWSDNPADSSWWVPLPLRLPGANNFEWRSFNSCSTSFQVDLPHNTQPWVLANTGRFGFYRVNYSQPLWAALSAAAMASQAEISSIDLAGLLDDAYALSHVRQLNVTVFLELTKALGVRARPELPPWTIALGWLQRMTDVLSTAALLDAGGSGTRWRDCMSNLRRFVTGRITNPFIQDVTIPGQDEPGLTFQVLPSDTAELRMLRPLVLKAAGFLGYKAATKTAVDLLKAQAAGESGAIAPDVAKAVYALAAGSGNEEAYEVLLQMYEQASDAADKDRVLLALGRVTTRPLISRTLQYALSPAVRTQDVAKLLVAVAKQGGLGFNMTWEFIINRAHDILQKYGGDDVTYSLGSKLNQLARLFVDEVLLDRLKQLAQAKPTIFSPTFFDEANEARMLNHDWLRFQGVDACKWLASAVQDQR